MEVGANVETLTVETWGGTFSVGQWKHGVERSV